MSGSDLDVSFTGLCLFVPDRNSNLLHVFLLRSDPEMPHVPRLYVQDGTHVKGCFFTSNGTFVDLNGATVDFSGLPSSTGGLVIPTNVADITAATQGQGLVERKYLRKGVPPAAVAHFILPSGAIRSVSGIRCKFDNATQELAVCATVTIAGAGNPVQVATALASLGITSSELPIVGNSIRLLIVNVPKEELPGESHTSVQVQADDEVPHFKMFYALVAPASLGHKCPKYAVDFTLQAGISCPCEPTSHGSFIRCMVAQAEPSPAAEE